ncbi:hypothetical protein B0H14DRAFT_3479548 [Mycena olivaceomarginata]|nr:hypothetical protein B0H14DRAFT_3479548 [Mycena olivaceomarginata]
MAFVKHWVQNGSTELTGTCLPRPLPAHPLPARPLPARPLPARPLPTHPAPRSQRTIQNRARASQAYARTLAAACPPPRRPPSQRTPWRMVTADISKNPRPSPAARPPTRFDKKRFEEKKRCPLGSQHTTKTECSRLWDNSAGTGTLLPVRTPNMSKIH